MTCGECTINYEEIVRSDWSGELAIRYALKEKGAPMKGSFVPEFDKKYIFYKFNDELNMRYIFKWKQTN